MNELTTSLVEDMHELLERRIDAWERKSADTDRLLAELEERVAVLAFSGAERFEEMRAMENRFSDLMRGVVEGTRRPFVGLRRRVGWVLAEASAWFYD